MKKTIKLLSLFLCTVLLCTSIPLSSSITASAATEYTSGYYTYTVSNGEATITDCDESISGDVIIPSTLGGYPVTTIGWAAFEWLEHLSEITLPKSVTRIDGLAFCACTNLSKINFSSNVSFVGESAFHFTEWYNNFRSNHANGVIYFGDTAYDYKSASNGTDDVVIADGTKYINLTSYRDDFASITIPNSVIEISFISFDYNFPTIYANKNSYAEKWALENNRPFKYIGLNTTEMYVMIANEYPQYLKNDAVDAFFANLNNHCYDVIEDYDEGDKKLLAFAESFVNGSKILSQNVFAHLGVGQTIEEEWLEKNTLEFIQSLENADTLAADIWEEISECYDQMEFIYKTSDSVSKDILIEEIANAQKHLTKSEVKTVVDKIYEDIDAFGVEKFFDTSETVIDGLNIAVYACQLYQLETTTLKHVMDLIPQNTPLYSGLNNILTTIEGNPANYICENYLSDIVGPKLVEALKDIGKTVFVKITENYTNVEVVLPDISVASSIVKLSSKVIYEHIYQGAKIDEIYGAITAYDFYATANISLTEMITQLIQHKLNGTTPPTKLLTDYEFMYNVRRILSNQYIDSCIEIAKSDAQVEDLNNIKSTLNDDSYLSFDSYIKRYCYNDLKTDIHNGEIKCEHSYSYVSGTVTPTCTESGYSQYYCPTCKENFNSDYTSALGHAYVSTIYPATCTTYGYTLYNCERCFTSYSDNHINAIGHTVVDWTITKQPTIYEEGLKQQICNVCEDIIAEEAIPKLIYHGDTNGDGQISILDLSEMLKALLSATIGDEHEECFDANSDGEVDIRDLVRIKKTIGGIID